MDIVLERIAISLKINASLHSQVNAADETMLAMASALGVTKLPYFHMYTHGQLAKNFTANLHKVSYLRRAISDCKQCLTPGCHEPTEPTPFMSKSLE